MRRSQNTRSKRLRPMRSRPSLPFSAVWTSWPSIFRASEISSRTARSSSITRIRARPMLPPRQVDLVPVHAILRREREPNPMNTSEQSAGRRAPGRHVAGRRAFVNSLGTGLLLAPLAARVQAAARVVRIGLLTPSSITPRGPLTETRQRLREMGYVEGRDIQFEVRAANEDFERLPDLAADLVRSKVDLIVAISSPAIRAAENATTSIPIVMVSGTDPVAGLFVASLARPEGNVTGVTTYVPELAAKRLEALRECLPGLKRVAVLANLRNPSSAVEVKEIDTADRKSTRLNS